VVGAAVLQRSAHNRDRVEAVRLTDTGNLRRRLIKSAVDTAIARAKSRKRPAQHTTRPVGDVECEIIGPSAVVCKQTGSRSNVNVCELRSVRESLLSLKSANDKRCFSNVYVEGRKIQFLLDFGSTVNILPFKMMTMIGKCQADLIPSRSMLYWLYYTVCLASSVG